MKKLIILMIAMAAALGIFTLIYGAASLKHTDEFLEQTDRFIERMEEER